MRNLFGKTTETVEGDKVEIIGSAEYKSEPDQIYVRYIGKTTTEGLPIKAWIYPGQLVWPDELTATEH